MDIQQGISIETHSEYIKDFGKKFYESVKNLIDKNAQKKYFTDLFSETDKALVQEIARHARFSIECVKKFHGRVDLVKKVYKLDIFLKWL